MWKWRSDFVVKEIKARSPPPAQQFKEEVPTRKMASAALVAAPAKTAPRAAAAPPAGKWRKRGKNPARPARARAWARRKLMVGDFHEFWLWINGHGLEIGDAALRRRARRVTSGAAVGAPALERPTAEQQTAESKRGAGPLDKQAGLVAEAEPRLRREGNGK